MEVTDSYICLSVAQKKEGVQKVIFGHPLFNSKNFNFKQQFSPGKFQL